ncbi:MAG: T9SS type A sorting domain-containing protein [Bacteroidota bacterium]
MKKLILSTIGLGMALVSFSQQDMNIKNKGVLDVNKANAHKSKTLSKDARSEWYNPLDILGTADFKTYIGFMMNDSLAKFIDDQGVASQGRTFQAMAQIIDPKDNAIDLGADPTIKMSKFTNYTVDSISFRYSYIRRVDSINDGLGNPVPVVDTLFVYYFKGNQISRNQSIQGATSRFGYIGYDFTKRRPNNYFDIDTVLLGADLATGAPTSTGWRSAELGLAAPAGMTVSANGGSNADNLIAYAVQFKNGTTYDDTYVFEDRRDSTVVPANTKWVNYFCYRMGANEGTTPITSTFFNSSLFVPQDFSYAMKNGWTGWYPGIGFTNDQYLDAGAKLSSSNIAVKEVANSFSLGQAFPNPTSNDVTIAFNLKSSKNVKISILNLLGQEVINVANDKFAAGSNEVKVDVSNLNAGVYFYSMTVDGVSQAQKLVIK